MTKRDDFSARTINTLAKRVGNFCSNPECKRLTTGPALNEEESINIGKAAHITAAAIGGPRFDPNLTSQERRNISNGIWLCGTCADVIDRDSLRYTVDSLLKWKQEAEEYAFKAISALPASALPVVTQVLLDEHDREYLQSLNLSPKDDIEFITKQMKEAGLNDIATFQNSRLWPQYTIPLHLTLLGSVSQTSINLESIAKGAIVAENINIISSPGTGKTTTLIQLAEHILNGNKAIATLVPLGEWSDRLETFFEFLARRNAFCLFKPQHFMQLAYYGRLILLLDGWNELNPDARIRAERDINALRRDFSLLGIITTTRAQKSSTKSINIEIEPLSRDQQIEIARHLRGDEGENLLDQALRIPSLREIISIPLYLNALLLNKTDKLPETKEELLSIFEKQHTTAPDKIEILEKELLGFHNNMLTGLALEANGTANTNISEEHARRALSLVIQSLQDNGQITTPFQPATVINVLINTHLIIRHSNTSMISFQHQQFQEWYASFHVENTMITASQGDPNAKRILRTEILNWIAWEESILFACERLSRRDEMGEQAIAKAILDTLGIDPMLAAEMIYRSNPKVWTLISDKVRAFVKQWHTTNTIDRSIRFMITSGKPEFSEYIWTLLSNPERQVYLEVVYKAKPFRPSVLGPDAKKRLSEMPVNTRADVISSIVHKSGLDGIELATELAISDRNPQVVAEILESLQFRRADRHIKDILQHASNETWELIARKGYPDNLRDQAQNIRLFDLREKFIRNETDPVKIINYLIETNKMQNNAEDRIQQIIQSQEFPISNNNIHFVLEKAFKIYPQAVAKAILNRITNCLQIPYHTEEYLDNLPPIENGPIAKMVLDSTIPKNIARPAYSIIGPLILGCLMEKLFILHEKYHTSNNSLDSSETKEYHRLSEAILISRQLSFLEAVLNQSNTKLLPRIQIITELLARHSKDHELTPFIVSEDIKERLIATLKRWLKIILSSSDAIQDLLSNIARVISRIPDERFVDDLQLMLQRELDEQEKLRNVSITKHQAVVDYSPQYRKAFANIGNDKIIKLMKKYLTNITFGQTAACILLDIWNKKASSQQRSEDYEFTDMIFDVIKKIGKPNNNINLLIHALRLAKVALNMPYRDKKIILEDLYSLPMKYAYKQELLTAATKAGEVISSNIIFAGLQELLEEAKLQPWRLDKNRGELMGWITLFAFSDNPMTVITAIDYLPPTYQQPWNLDRLFYSLANSPSDQALDVLMALAEKNNEVTQYQGWLNALLILNSEASALTLLNLLCNGTFTKGTNGLDAWRITQKMAILAKKYPAICSELVALHDEMTDIKITSLLEDILITLPDPKIILILIRYFSKNNQNYDYRLSTAIRNIAIGQKEINDFPGAFEQFSIPLIELRKQLFSIITGNDTQSTLAEKCLNEIDELRDEYGHINNEPRHPDIASGLPWPTQAI